MWTGIGKQEPSEAWSSPVGFCRSVFGKRPPSETGVLLVSLQLLEY